MTSHPHSESTFPQSRKILAEIRAGVPDDEQAKIAGGLWTLSSATEDTAILRCDPPLEEAGSSKGALTGSDLAR